MALAHGQILDGKYVIGRRLGEGGMSVVYLGVNERIGKEVAVKVLNRSVMDEPDVAQRFQLEARIVSRIRSPYVADVYDFGALETGEPFMVMEYLDGESLGTLIERERRLPTRTVATMAHQILEGLSASHTAGVIHRDLKPENIIVLKRGKGSGGLMPPEKDVVVKIVDFGISKVLVGASASFPEARKTADGAVLGTPLYMSPEQARGSTLLIDQRTDLYSLGVIMYEAIAGEPPLMGENVNDLLFRVALDDPMPLIERMPATDPGFAAIVAKAMAKSVVDRYQTAEEMLDALLEWKAQFLSGSQSIVPAARPAANVRSAPTETVQIMTPMTLTAPPRREETRTVRGRHSLVTRARRLAYALPAVAIVLFLLGNRRPASEPHDVAAAMTALPAPIEPPAPVLVPITPSSLVTIEPAPVLSQIKTPVASPIARSRPPVRVRPTHAPVDGGTTGSGGADAIATATIDPAPVPTIVPSAAAVDEGKPLLSDPPAQD